jgi:glutamate---cysteine ligase / carboxylate-amine ligase
MTRSFGLFQRFGVELEYMIVDGATLDARPEADRLIQTVAGHLDGVVSRGSLEWSNELALHLIELKTGRPARRLAGLADAFQNEVRFINRLLAKSGARLLPTAMHPWMNPRRESRLWPHGNREIYAAFDRIFDCSGHGWTNLQSVHLNLPFRTAAEFRRLHTAIRLLLPIMPALAASSPFLEGRPASVLDMRLHVYRHNCRRIPFLTGQVIPEPTRSPAEYRRLILRRIYRDLAPHDPDRILREEWANARGAIARFVRNTIEIRVLDIQECPRADLAVLELISSVLAALTREELSPESKQRAPGTVPLRRLLVETIRAGGRTRLRDRSYAAALGWRAAATPTVRDLWGHLLETASTKRTPWRPVVETILVEGCLSERILKATGPKPGHRQLQSVYARLADCLDRGELFYA